uniref:Uncharacterized protein n=1 Tax=Gadus morhua TaxID=8049 RepID=A0A8C5AFH6_GADMO
PGQLWLYTLLSEGWVLGFYQRLHRRRCSPWCQTGMASANTSWPEENFSCSICLDVFSSPVTTPCGHNFCRTCITKFWDEQVKYKCPVCNELFNTRPDLRVNILFSEMVDRFGTSLRVKEPEETSAGRAYGPSGRQDVRPPSYAGTLRRSLDQLEETLNMEMKKPRDAELKRVQQYEVDVTLDPDTAYLWLTLSVDGKRVHYGGVKIKKRLRDNPKRFTQYTCVLTRQSFSSGRFYFEVQVKDKTDWFVGVARESSDRKGLIPLIPENGYWTLHYYKDGLIFVDNPLVCVPLRAGLQKVGVFVDYDEGLVSFYDVEARVDLYSATGCTFSEPLYPILGPGHPFYQGNNPAPLIISPVNQTD